MASQYEVILVSAVIRRSKHRKAAISGRSPLIMIVTMDLSLITIYRLTYKKNHLVSLCQRKYVMKPISHIFYIISNITIFRLLSQFQERSCIFAYFEGLIANAMALIFHWLCIVYLYLCFL